MTAIQWSNWNKLARTFNLTAFIELKEYLQDFLFKSHFDHLFHHVINSAQKKITRTKKIKFRESAMRIVQIKMIQNQKNDQFKFFNRYSDIRNWNIIDHYVYFMYDVRKKNTHHVQEIFYDKKLSDDQMNIQLWALLKRAEADMTSVKRIFFHTFESSTFLYLSKNSIMNSNMSLLNWNQSKKTHAEFEKINSVVDINDQQFTNVERMSLKNKFKIMNLSQRFWQCVVIDTVLKMIFNLKTIRQLFEHIYNVDWMTDALNTVWLKKTMRKHEFFQIIYESLTLEQQNFQKHFEQIFNNVQYQRKDLIEICEILNILSIDTLRMLEMILFQSFRYWQSFAIKTIKDFEKKERIRFVFFVDVVDLKKTWIMIKWLLSMNFQLIDLTKISTNYIILTDYFFRN